jgi:prepilin-type N-terminal cleavage/methylation domain-containing protein
MSASSRRQRGYTAVELMMAISIFAIGIAGIMSMEKVTSVSNQHAKNLAIATHIAESWLDMLATDAVAWNVVTNANATSWFLPAYSTVFAFGPGFDALGNPVNTTTSTAGVQFCSHLRLSWLYPPPVGSEAGNGLIRIEVRVFWLRDGQASPVPNLNPCDPTMPIANINATTASSTFHFVQKISAVRENMK